jgi:hypothetical protein
MRSSRSFLGGWALLLVLFSPVQGQGQKKCYFHNGDLAAFDIPCTNLTTLDDADIPCCGSGRQCLENRMCSSVEGDPNPSRGSCTDQSWQSGNCPQFCDSGMSISPILRTVELILHSYKGCTNLQLYCSTRLER